MILVVGVFSCREHLAINVRREILQIGTVGVGTKQKLSRDDDDGEVKGYGYFIESSALLIHPFSPDWHVGGSVLAPGRLSSISKSPDSSFAFSPCGYLDWVVIRGSRKSFSGEVGKSRRR
jgi:hypothetical protein